MLLEIHPKIPMRNKDITKDFYLNSLQFEDFGIRDYPGYLMVKKDQIQIHLFEFKELNPLENYGQVYIRTNSLDHWFTLAMDKKLNIPQGGRLQLKPWGQREFSILDPDYNLITFGEST